MAKRSPVKRRATARKWNSRYGLVKDEGAATEPEEDDGVPIAGSQLAEAFVDDAWGTAKSVEDLKEHRDYKKWLKGKGLTAAGVEGLEKRLGLYQDLREMDPSGFRMMLGPLLVAQCLPCTPLQYALEYLGNVFLTSVLVLVSLTATSQAALWLAVAGIVGNMCMWLQASSLYGRCGGLWLEDTLWGHKAHWKKALASNAIEVLYCLCSLGIGSLVSLYLRLQWEGGCQSLGERMMGVQLVKEVLVAPELPETPPRAKREVRELGPDSLPEDYACSSGAIRRRSS